MSYLLFLFLSLSTALNFYDTDYFSYDILNDINIQYSTDIGNTGYGFWQRVENGYTGPGPYIPQIPSSSYMSNILIRIPTNNHCGVADGLASADAVVGENIEIICYGSNLVLRQGSTYYFHPNLPGSQLIYFKSANVLSGSRLSSGDGVILEGNNVKWTVGASESRTLYYVNEMTGMNGTVTFISSCGNGGTPISNGNCICPYGYWGVGCSMQSCPYGNGNASNTDDGCLCNPGWGGWYCQYPVTDNGCGDFQSTTSNATYNPTSIPCDCSAKWGNAYSYPEGTQWLNEQVMRSDSNFMGGPMLNISQAKMTCYMNVLCDGIMVWNSTSSGKPYSYYFLFTFQLIYFFSDYGFDDLFFQIFNTEGFGVPQIPSLTLYRLDRYYEKICDNTTNEMFDAVAIEQGLPALPYQLNVPFMYLAYSKYIGCPYTMSNGSCCYLPSANYTCYHPMPTEAVLFASSSINGINGVDSWLIPTYWFLTQYAVAWSLNGSNGSCPLGPTTSPELTSTCQLNNCYPNPCMNGATCINGVNSYTCSCASRFFGTNCTLGNNL